jgi:hypothetical protein
VYLEHAQTEEIDIQLKNRLEREKSTDTTSGGSNITVIEGHVPEEGSTGVVLDASSLNLVDDVTNDKIVESESDKNSANTHSTNGNESSSTSTCNSASSSKQLHSCLLRRDSARTSIKKKVRCSETAEVIPPPDYYVNNDELRVTAGDDDDEDDVFSDKIPAQVSRGNMCTPYVQRKGSLPMLEALPDWFPNPRFFTFITCVFFHPSIHPRSVENIFHSLFIHSLTLSPIHSCLLYFLCTLFILYFCSHISLSLRVFLNVHAY